MRKMTDAAHGEAETHPWNMLGTPRCWGAETEGSPESHSSSPDPILACGRMSSKEVFLPLFKGRSLKSPRDTEKSFRVTRRSCEGEPRSRPARVLTRPSSKGALGNAEPKKRSEQLETQIS